jgi:hypothetical protein
LPKEELIHPPVKCRYLDYRLPNSRVIFLPVIHVELTSETQEFTAIGLLDSGATTSFIPYEIAEILEILPKQRRCIEVETAGGPCGFFSVTLKKLSLLAGGRKYSEFPDINLLVPAPEKDLPYVILGRDYVFKRFHITFKENIQKFELQHHRWDKK